MSDKKTENTGVYVHTLRKPVEFEGETYETLTFNYSTLTGGDMINAEEDAFMPSVAPELQGNILAGLAARAAGIDVGLLAALPIAEFAKIRRETKNFMTSLD